MPSKATTTQGEAWDQVALEHIGDELNMSDLLAENIEEADALLFSGEIVLTVPDKTESTARRTPPPWERM